MNAANKSKLANFFTALVAVIAVVQMRYTAPPYDIDTVFRMTTILTYLSLTFTVWKQYLSPEVNDVGQKVTFGIAIIATIGGLIDLVPAFKLPDTTSQTIKMIITSCVTVLNVLSKQLFPSQMQKDKMKDLKYQ